MKAVISVVTCGIALQTYALAATISLVSHNPFIPPSYASNRTATTPASNQKPSVNHFEFKGVTKIGDKYLFSILDKRTKKAEWLDPQEEVNGFRLISYDPQTRTIEYVWKGMKGSAKMTVSDAPYALDLLASNQPQRSNPSSPVSESDSRHNRPNTSNTRVTFEDLDNNPAHTSATFYSNNQPRFASELSDVGETPDFTDEVPAPTPKRRKARSIFPRNNVNNPNGTLPD